MANLDTTATEVLIVQISDLHFGREIHPRPTRTGTLNPPTVVPTVPGLEPHCVGACRALENILGRLCRRFHDAFKILVVAGDLTVSGDDSEFGLALTYLARRVSTTLHLSTGLGGMFDHTVMVPGNHDHWRGRYRSSTLNPGTPQIHGVYFRTPSTNPCFHDVIDTPNLQVQLMGVDSCSGNQSNILARGNIDPGVTTQLAGEISRADKLVAQSGKAVARFLVCHHSIAPGGGVMGLAHALDRASHRRLTAFLAAQHIHFVLTGHTHTTDLSIANQSRYGVELRSGTALQGNSPSNEFLAHRLRYDGLRAVVESVAFVRVPGGQFRGGPTVSRRL